MFINTVLLIAMVLAALWAVMATRLLRAAIALALTSILLSVIMFRLNAGLAAVFELSVCAGLISVIFISTISITQSLSEKEFQEHKRKRLERFWYLPFFTITAIAFSLLYFGKDVQLQMPLVKTVDDVRNILWNLRQFDLLGQMIILLAGSIGVLLLFNQRKDNE